ncbi:hypothetical protein CFP56_038901, partial [Quercus suber]
MKYLDSGKGNPDPWKDPEEYVNIGDYMCQVHVKPNGKIMSLSLYVNHDNTRVVDISKDLLLKWWTCLKMLKTAGFEIQFAFNHLKRVADAYFGLCVEKRIKEVQNLQNKIEALEKERECIRSAESAKSNLIEKCLREASIFKHGIASAGL